MFVTILLSISLLAVDLASAQDSSLKIDITNIVSCARKSHAGDNVSVNYNGTLTTGEQFDSSYHADGAHPFSFTLGEGYVIRGWDLGLLDMCVGERRTLTIAPGLAYGNEAVGPIPAKSTLVFETELMDIKDAEDAGEE